MSIQSMIRWLLPREDSFYDLLEKQAVAASEGATALGAFREANVQAEPVRAEVQAKEHAGDAIVHAVEEALAKTFVTPIDREDIQKLSSELDDILDFMNGAARACVLMGVNRPTPAMVVQMDKLAECTTILRDCVPNLRKHEYSALIESSRAIRKIEKDADRVYRDELHALFHDDKIDAKQLLRETRVLEDLERAIDSCEKVGDTLANLAVKNG